MFYDIVASHLHVRQPADLDDSTFKFLGILCMIRKRRGRLKYQGIGRLLSQPTLESDGMDDV